MNSKIAELILLLFNLMLWIKVLFIINYPPLKALYHPAILRADWKYGAATGILLLLLLMLFLSGVALLRSYRPKRKKPASLQGQNHPAIQSISYAVPVVTVIHDRAEDKESLKKAPNMMGEEPQRREIYTPYPGLDTLD